MIITKIIQHDLTLTDPINTVASKDGLLIAANTDLKGYCKGGCLVLSVLRIIREGPIIRTQDMSASSATVSLMLEIEAIELHAGEIIADCKVTGIRNTGDKHQQRIISAVSQNIVVYAAADKMFEFVTIGQIIPMIVISAKYLPRSTNVHVRAYPFVPAVVPTYYAVEPSIEAPSFYSAITEELDNELEAVRALQVSKPAAVETFVTLLDLYSGVKQHVSPKYSRTAKELVAATLEESLEIGYMSRELRAPLFDLKVDISQPPTKAHVIQALYGDALIAVLRDFCNHLRLIREMVRIYDDEATVNAHVGLWAVYKKVKADALRAAALKTGEAK